MFEKRRIEASKTASGTYNLIGEDFSKKNCPYGLGVQCGSWCSRFTIDELDGLVLCGEESIGQLVEVPEGAPVTRGK